jgi:hypothetical protein
MPHIRAEAGEHVQSLNSDGLRCKEFFFTSATFTSGIRHEPRSR